MKRERLCGSLLILPYLAPVPQALVHAARPRPFIPRIREMICKNAYLACSLPTGNDLLMMQCSGIYCIAERRFGVCPQPSLGRFLPRLWAARQRAASFFAQGLVTLAKEPSKTLEFARFLPTSSGAFLRRTKHRRRCLPFTARAAPVDPLDDERHAKGCCDAAICQKEASGTRGDKRRPLAFKAGLCSRFGD